MTNEELLRNILTELRQMNHNFGELFECLKSVQKPPQKRAPRPKLPPLTQAEAGEYQRVFANLYQKWISGKESEVSKELEAYSPDEIRRFGDANNLNVTSKMAKDKVLRLISVRFREKKMLNHNVNVTKPRIEQTDKNDKLGG